MPVTIKQDQKEIFDFLSTHKVGVLATTDPNGEPHASAIYYIVDKGLNISFLTKTQTKKADNLQHNNHAMLVVYEAETQTTVQITGVVSEVTDTLEINRLFSQLVYASLETSNTTTPPIAKLDEGDYVGYQLKPKQVRMAVFSHPKSGNYNTLFTTVVPE